MNDYLNTLITNFGSRDFKQFASYVNNVFQKEINSIKSKKEKNKYILIRKQILRYIVTNQSTITSKLQQKK